MAKTGHFSILFYHLPRHSDSVSSLDGKIALLYLLTVGVERIIADIVEHLTKVLRRHPIAALISAGRRQDTYALVLRQIAALPAVYKFKRTAHPDTDLLQSRLPCIVRQRLSYMHREYFDDLQSYASFPAMSNSMTCPKKYDSFLRRS